MKAYIAVGMVYDAINYSIITVNLEEYNEEYNTEIDYIKNLNYAYGANVIEPFQLYLTEEEAEQRRSELQLIHLLLK